MQISLVSASLLILYIENIIKFIWQTTLRKFTELFLQISALHTSRYLLGILRFNQIYLINITATEYFGL